ncbi:MAG: protoporphyrinogen oxidase, partial [Planctomycetota bacterium]
MNEPLYRDVVVVGGGISGLTVAWHLKRAGMDVVLLESAASVGGCTQTQRRDGFLLEKGPFNVIVRDPAFAALLEDLGEEARVIQASPVAKKRYILHGGRLHAVPTNPLALLTTGLLSMGGRVRLLRGLVYSKPLGNHEETIAQAITRRLGRETAETIVSAAVSGIYAGDIDVLGWNACFPKIAEHDARATSPIGYALRTMLSRRFAKRGGDDSLVACTRDVGSSRGLKPAARDAQTKEDPEERKRRSKIGRANGRETSARKRKWRGLVSLDGGLGAITETLARRLGTDVWTRTNVMAVEREGDGFLVRIRRDDESGEGSSLRCRRLVLAVSATPAGRLLA